MLNTMFKSQYFGTEIKCGKKPKETTTMKENLFLNIRNDAEKRKRLSQRKNTTVTGDLCCPATTCTLLHLLAGKISF